ncbi:MAG: sugar-binding transcriptional regulator, partial [Bifidobacteriaceae bacterium]|nr:sugar-binding transcriptional regulator [Bifidobacteriaceae bacterium]
MAAHREESAKPDRARLMAKVAHMYHQRGLRQNEIAGKLNLSQARVSRLLKAAHETGMVRIVVTPPTGVHSDVEETLEQRFGLEAALVAESPLGDESALAVVGAAAAAYLENTVLGHEVIGISSWSATLLAMVDSLPDIRGQGARQIVQLVGGRSDSAQQAKANWLLTRLSSLTGAEPVFLNAPGIVSSRQEAASLLGAPYLQEATAAWKDVTLALVGIGSVEPSPLALESGNAFPPEAISELRSAGAVGDICFRFFDTEGRLVPSKLNESVVGISPDALKAAPRRIGVAGGGGKAPAILGALRGHWINVLITDLATAHALLDQTP